MGHYFFSILRIQGKTRAKPFQALLLWGYTLVITGLCMAFKHRMSFATNLAANFGCYWLRIMPEIVSKLWALPSEVAVLFDLNLSRRPFLGQVADLDLLLCTGFNQEHADLFSQCRPCRTLKYQVCGTGASPALRLQDFMALNQASGGPAPQLQRLATATGRAAVTNGHSHRMFCWYLSLNLCCLSCGSKGKSFKRKTLHFFLLVQRAR